VTQEHKILAQNRQILDTMSSEQKQQLLMALEHPEQYTDYVTWVKENPQNNISQLFNYIEGTDFNFEQMISSQT
jgi:hypothetical protein